MDTDKPREDTDTERRLIAAQALLDIVADYDMLLFLDGQPGAVHMKSIVVLLTPLVGTRQQAIELAYAARDQSRPLTQVLPELRRMWDRRGVDHHVAIDDVVRHGERLRIVEAPDGGSYEITVAAGEIAVTARLLPHEMNHAVAQVLLLPGLSDRFPDRRLH